MIRRNFFGRVRLLGEATVKRLQEATAQNNVEAMELERSKLKAIKAVSDFIREGSWCTAKGLERAIFLLKNPYKDAEEEFGITRQSISASTRLVEKQLAKQFDLSVLDLIKGGKIPEAMALFDAGKSGTVNTVFSSDTRKLLPAVGKRVKPFAFADCVAELAFLQSISNFVIAESLKEVNQDKVSFLLSILEENKGGNARNVLKAHLNSREFTEVGLSKLKETETW